MKTSIGIVSGLLLALVVLYTRARTLRCLALVAVILVVVGIMHALRRAS